MCDAVNDNQARVNNPGTMYKGTAPANLLWMVRQVLCVRDIASWVIVGVVKVKFIWLKFTDG